MEGTERQRVPCQESATLLEFLLEIVQVTGRNCHGMVSRLSVLPRRKVKRDHFYLEMKPWQLTLPPGRSGFHRAHQQDALVWEGHGSTRHPQPPPVSTLHHVQFTCYTSDFDLLDQNGSSTADTMGWGGTGHSSSAGHGSLGNDTVFKGRSSVSPSGETCGRERQGGARASDPAFGTNCVTFVKSQRGWKRIQSEQPPLSAARFSP